MCKIRGILCNASLFGRAMVSAVIPFVFSGLYRQAVMDPLLLFSLQFPLPEKEERDVA